MKNNLVALSAGIMMGFGLCVSQMVNPAKVIGFLDVFGDWDPTLAFVMAGALAVTMVSFRGILKCKRPLCADQFSLPVKTKIDARLMAGAALFGVGWGLSGFCPAPAIASLAFGLQKSFVFVCSMLVGMLVYQKCFNK